MSALTRSHPDTILLFETVHTLQSELHAPGQQLSAIGITGPFISHLGSNAEAKKWIGPETQVIDYAGTTATPGLVDAHVHPVLGQSMVRGVYLGDAKTLEEVSRVLASAGSDQNDEEWVLAWGLKLTLFGSQVPSNEVIEPVLPRRLVFIHFFDGHAGLASRAALTLANVTGATRFPDNSEVVLDTQGRPTGYLRELAAMDLVKSLIPPLTFDDKVRGVYHLLCDMAATGLTGIEMMDLGDPDSLEIFAAIEERWKLPVRIRIAPWVLAMDDPSMTDLVIKMQGLSGQRYTVRGVKLMIDGTVDNGTAWLYEPDACGESLKSLWTSTGDYTRVLQRLHTAGVTTTTHAIGDHAVGYVVAAIAALPQTNTVHRIEHIEVATDVDLRQLASSGATASMQPTHCTHFLQPDGDDAWSDRLGDERRSLGFRLRTVVDSGVILALGSDWPVAPFDPRLTLADAQTRRRTDDPESQPIDRIHRLSAYEALQGYTRNVALSTGIDGGIIRVGGRADLTIWSSDPLRVSPSTLVETPIVATYVDGELSYANPDIAAVR